MKCLAILFLVCAFLFGSNASAADARTCCDDEHCTFVQCVEMGCMTIAAPVMPGCVSRAGTGKPVNDWRQPLEPAVPCPVAAIVKPPD